MLNVYIFGGLNENQILGRRHTNLMYHITNSNGSQSWSNYQYKQV